MISNVKLKKGVNDKIFFNTYRPNLRQDVDFEFWGNVHKYVKDCDYPIFVSSAFWFIDKLIMQRSDYSGGGMKFYVKDKLYYEIKNREVEYIDITYLGVK